MGVKAALRHSNVPLDAPDAVISDQDPTLGSKAGLPTSSSRALERQPSQRRKVDSVLDDIMGDPDDFRDLADSDAESDGGRWEDAVRAALEHEEAGAGVDRPEVRDSEDGLSKACEDDNVKKASGTAEENYKHSSCSPSFTGDPGCSGQSGKGMQEKAQENEGRKHSSNVVTASSGSKESKLYNTKYFIIKSLNHHNIVKSIEKGIWATQAMNEPVLNEAFETSGRVLLVFSVNMSGHFQGYAQMTSLIGRRRANVWSEANEGANPWGGTFGVDWLRLYDLPFQKTEHLKNPLNLFKPVKISRDCQELTQEVGDALCALIDEGSDRDGRPKRKVTAADLAAFSSKRKRKELVSIPSNGSQSRNQMSAGSSGGARFSAHYSPRVSPRVAPDSFSLPGPLTRASGGFSSHASYPIDARRISRSRSPRAVSERGLAQEREDGREYRHRERERPLERDRPRDRARSNSSGRSADLPVEEDLLNMTYEEYLQRHGHPREFSKSYQQGIGPFFQNSAGPGYSGGWTGRNAGMGFPEDQYSSYINNWYSRQGPGMGGDAVYGANGMGTNYPAMRPPDTHWLGHPDDVRERRPARPADGMHGPGYPETNGRSSRHIERIIGAGS